MPLPEPIESIRLRPHVQIDVYGLSAQIPHAPFGAQQFLRELAAECGIMNLFIPKLGGLDRRVADTADESQWGDCGSGQDSNIRLRVSRGWCHGVLLRPYTFSGVLMLTRDCPTTVIVDSQTNVVSVLHAGRDQLHPIPQPTRAHDESPRDRLNIIQEGLRMLHAQNPHLGPHSMYASIVCGIGPADFPNRWDYPKTGDHYREITEWFLKACGRRSVPGDPHEGHLDLPHIIRDFLRRDGIPRRHITADHVSTAGDPRYASVRRDRTSNTLQNGVLVRYV